jgi:hypothetical protein
MPTEIWVAIIGALFVAGGYFLRPLGDFVGEIVRDRRDEGKRKTQFQYETLIGIADALQADRATFRDPDATREHRAKLESLTFRVADEELRRRLEALLVAEGGTQSDEYGNVLRRLGEALREL